MAIQSSGVITLQDIEDEFGGTGSISLSEYYRNGSYVTSNNTSVPTSGTISLSNFYGAANQFTFNITSHTQNANIRTLAINAGWDGSAPLIANVNAGIYLWSDSTSTGGAIISGSFAGGLTLNNYGKIIGKGGKGGSKSGTGTITVAPQDGGPAISVASGGVSIVNNSGAYIAGGGGGGAGNTGSGNNDNSPFGCSGGGGAGGGVGGGYSPGSGGAIGQSGGDGYSGSSRDQPVAPGRGGGAGGGGGGGLNATSGQDTATGGGGGRILPGVGGQGCYISGFGASGGSAGNAGGTGSTSRYASGGGGWGAAGGGGGGAGGAAISGTSVSLTNNGTIYGST